LITRMLTVNPNRRITAAEALQHDWVVSIGVHTNDLFSLGTTSGVPVMQARFGEFNLERRATARSHQAMLGLLGLPEDDEELLHSFTCSHADRTGQFILTPGHLAFLAYDHSAMFSQPITEVMSVCASTTIVTSAANDKSLILQMSNGKEVQLDGLWERDECIQLLQACGRHLKHPLQVVGEGEVVPTPHTQQSVPPADPVGATSPPPPPPPQQQQEQSVHQILQQQTVTAMAADLVTLQLPSADSVTGQRTDDQHG